MSTDSSIEQTTSLPVRVTIREAWCKASEPWWQAFLAILPIFIITRLLLLILTYFGIVLFTLPTNSLFALSFNQVLYSWYHWDAIRYLTIARQGYLDEGSSTFFPLYPTLVHLVSTLLHIDILLTGLLISNLAFVGALIVFFRLVAEGFDKETAKRCVLYLAIFPLALLSFAAYDISLFLLLTLLCFYGLRQRFWWLAGLFGGLAALTDMLGLLLFVIFLWELFRQQRTQITHTWYKNVLLLPPLMAALIIPAGFSVYGYALAKKFHDPFIFLHAYGVSQLQPIWNAPLVAIHSIASSSPYTFTAIHSIIELFFLVFFCILLTLSFIGAERLAKEQWGIALFSILVIVCGLLLPDYPAGVKSVSDPIPALQYVPLGAFVGFIMLARLGRISWLHQGYMLLALPLFAFFVLQLVTGH